MWWLGHGGAPRWKREQLPSQPSSGKWYGMNNNVDVKKVKRRSALDPDILRKSLGLWVLSVSGGQSNVGISGIDIETLSTFVARLSLFPVQIYTLYNLKANMNQTRTLFELFCTLRYFCFREGTYLIFVIFFTQPQFETWKFYTWKCVNSRQKLPRDKTA